jgi:hypothetical protein
MRQKGCAAILAALLVKRSSQFLIDLADQETCHFQSNTKMTDYEWRTT